MCLKEVTEENLKQNDERHEKHKGFNKKFSGKLPSMIDRVEERISVFEDKVQELDESVRGNHKIFKCVNGACANFRTS